MKKLAISLIVGASLVFTSSAFALQAMSTDNMKDATAQAGVSIALDDVIIETWVGATTYTDNDGNANGQAGNSYAGSISLSNRHSLTRYNAFGFSAGNYFTGTTHANDLVEVDNATRLFQFTGAGAHSGDTYGNPVTIDVGACDVLTLANFLNTGSTTTFVTGVTIGLPTLEISKSADSYTVTAGNVAGTAAVNNGAEFIEISTTGKTTQIYGGHIEIAPH